MKQPYKILIVDDNPANLKLAGDLLEIEGFEVYRSVDAQTALASMEESLPNLILMDISLPGIDGLTLTRKIKSEDKTKNIIIIALTALAMKSDKEKVLAAGCDGYISKPIDTRNFKNQINDYLNPANAHRNTILIADDNPTSLKLLKEIYESEGYDVKTAENGLKALEILVNEKIDLIVTDVLMPEMDGYFLCYKIRSNPELKDTPIIVYTATYTSLSEENIAKEMGADMFIRKPAPIKKMISSAAEILAKSHKYDRPIFIPNKSAEAMHQYSSDLINKLEQRNIELEKIKDDLEITLAHFRKAQKIANLGHWELDLSTQIATWSDEIYHILGLQKGVLPFNIESYFNLIHPEDMVNSHQIIQDALNNQTPYAFYHRIVSPGNSIKYLFVVGEFEMDKFNQPSKLVGIILDVTELTVKKEKLKEANKELETFIYKSSHDLRGPIATLMGLVELSKLELKDPQALQYIEKFEVVTIKLNATIAKLIKVMSLKTKILVPEGIKFKQLVEEVLFSLQSTPGFADTKFTLEFDSESEVISDREILADIMYCLIDNSIKFRDGSQVNEIIITHSLEDNRDNVIKIKDNGIGIREEDYQKIFNMFYRGTEKSIGPGLGLYIVKNAVELLKGSINVSSKKGEGAIFIIKMPQLELRTG